MAAAGAASVPNELPPVSCPSRLRSSSGADGGKPRSHRCAAIPDADRRCCCASDNRTVYETTPELSGYRGCERFSRHSLHVLMALIVLLMSDDARHRALVRDNSIVVGLIAGAAMASACDGGAERCAEPRRISWRSVRLQGAAAAPLALIPRRSPVLRGKTAARGLGGEGPAGWAAPGPLHRSREPAEPGATTGGRAGQGGVGSAGSRRRWRNRRGGRGRLADRAVQVGRDACGSGGHGQWHDRRHDRSGRRRRGDLAPAWCTGTSRRGAGTTASDSSGNGRKGTLHEPRRGHRLVLDGSRGRDGISQIGQFEQHERRLRRHSGQPEGNGSGNSGERSPPGST